MSCNPWSCKEVDTTEGLSTSHSTGNQNLKYSLVLVLQKYNILLSDLFLVSFSLFLDLFEVISFCN